MAAIAMSVFLGFLISLIVSAIIIYFATKLFGEEEGFGTALLTAVIGAILFTLATYFLGFGWIATIIGGIAWLIALGSLYGIGWIKALIIAVVIWVFALIIGLVLPTVAGPL